MTPESRLLFAIFEQAINDYIKLDPNSDICSADYFKSEEEDYETAEDFIFYDEKIYYGELVFAFEDLVEFFSEAIHLSPRQLRKKITEIAIEH